MAPICCAYIPLQSVIYTPPTASYINKVYFISESNADTTLCVVLNHPLSSGSKPTSFNPFSLYIYRPVREMNPILRHPEVSHSTVFWKGQSSILKLRH